MAKTGNGAKGSDKKCPLCKGDLADDKHLNMIPEGGRNTRDGGFANLVLGGNDISNHSLYEEGYTPQAHHLISISAMEDYGDECRVVGYDINCKENCVFLPQSPAKACQYAIQKHDGVHLKTYFSAVEGLVANVFVPKKNCDNFEDRKKQIIERLNTISQTILSNIMSFTFLLQKDSLNYLPGCIIGCSAAIKSGKKNKLVFDDLNLKKDVRWIERERADAANNIRDVMRKPKDIQDEFSEKASILDDELVCSVGRMHGLSPLVHTLTVGNVM